MSTPQTDPAQAILDASERLVQAAQALERAGDHTTNLAENLYNLIEERSVRHMPKKKAAQ